VTSGDAEGTVRTVQLAWERFQKTELDYMVYKLGGGGRRVLHN
jgi:hypothetical protein